MATSPYTGNYSVLKGIVKFTPTGGSERDLGNAPEIELTPAVEKLDHFSSRAGVRSKDRSVVTEKTVTLRIVLDELTAENLRMMLLGDAITTGTSGNPGFGIGAESEILGAISITGTNDIGSKIHLALPNVSFGPSGSLNLISEEWATIEVTAEVFWDETNGNFGTVEVDEVEEATA